VASFARLAFKNEKENEKEKETEKGKERKRERELSYAMEESDIPKSIECGHRWLNSDCKYSSLSKILLLNSSVN
jgi:hypothetical protein